MNNPIQMLKNMIPLKSPKDIALNMLKQNSNPIISNLIDMAEKGDVQGVENFAKNMLKEQGADFEKEFNAFMNNFR